MSTIFSYLSFSWTLADPVSTLQLQFVWLICLIVFLGGVVLVLFCSELGSYYVALAGLELTRDLFASTSLMLGLKVSATTTSFNSSPYKKNLYNKSQYPHSQNYN